MTKSIAFGAVHVVIAFGVGYALTGSFAVAGALTVVEPLVNTVAHYFFDRWWSARAAARTPALVAAEAASNRLAVAVAPLPGGSANLPAVATMAS